MNQKVKVLNNSYCKVMNIIGILGIAAMVIFLLCIWRQLPDKIPQHFTLAGEVDRWGGKGFLLLMPIAAAVIFVVVSVMERYTKVMNAGFKVTEQNRAVIYEELRNMTTTIKTVMVFIFFYIAGVVSFQKNLGIWFAFAVIILVSGPILMYYVRVKIRMAEIGADTHER